jgi:hypothetical protein
MQRLGDPAAESAGRMTTILWSYEINCKRRRSANKKFLSR